MRAGIIAVTGLLLVCACGKPAAHPAGPPAPRAQAAAAQAAATPAAAQVPAASAKDDSAYDRCMSQGEAAEGVTVAMLDCGGVEAERVDALLNAAYKAAMARLSPEAQERLRNAQRQWIKDRDRKCAETDNPGGSAAELEHQGCFIEETKARTTQLRLR